LLTCCTSGENAFHRGQGLQIPQIQLPHPYNELFAQDPDSFITALAQHKDFLRQFTYITGESKRPNSIPLGDFKDFTQLREVALSAQTRDLQAALLSQDGPPGLVSLSLEITSKEIFDGLPQLHHVFQSSGQVLAPEEVSSRLASKVSSVLFPRFSRAVLQRLQQLHVTLTDNAYISYLVPAGLRQQWIRLIRELWLNHDVKFFLYSRERTSIIPPTLFGEERRAPRDTVLYSLDSGFAEGNIETYNRYGMDDDIFGALGDELIEDDVDTWA
jgi:hypothetical protein